MVPRSFAGAVVVLLLAGAAACSGDDDGSGPPTTRAVPTSSTSAPQAEGTPPPLNPIEERVRNALEQVGLDAVRAELSPTSASMYAELEGGAEVFVSAYPTGASGGGFTTVSERAVAGLTVAEIEHGAGAGRRSRFTCGDLVVEAYGAAPVRFSSFDDFLASLIPALGCPID